MSALAWGRRFEKVEKAVGRQSLSVWARKALGQREAVRVLKSGEAWAPSCGSAS